ncbi:MAG TPA: glycosyltransferase family 4 protein [Mucilaginibacter sp.]|jgi:glycosyltransferase involved in cell wall biosynthesis
MKKLAIVTTHPIQYYAPVFQLLHQRKRIAVKVFYTWGETSIKKFDPGFNKKIEWDIPLLEGYPYEWVKNTAKDPGTHHFNGINNPEIGSQIAEWQPDAILIYGWGFRGHLKTMRYFKNKIPVLFRGDSTLLDEKKGVKTLLRYAYLNRIYSYVDYALYVGTNSKAYFKKHGLKENQLRFAPHAIDNDRFGADRKLEANELRHRLGIDEDGVVVLFTGKFEEKKAPVLLLDAFLAMKRPNAHLLFVGNGSLETQLKLKAQEHSNIHFLPFQNQSQMPVVYQACDIFCIPSKGPNETWGLAINEAMACGNAILSSDKVGAAVDLIKSDRNGFIFKSGDLPDLIIKLNRLLDNSKNELEEIGRNSQEMIKDWSLENQVIAIELLTNNE